MASLDMTAAEDALKIIYDSKAYHDLCYTDHPLLAMLPKDKSFDGKQKELPLRFGGNQGRSRTFASALANRTGGLYDGFFLTRKKDYGITEIDTEPMLASASSAGGIIPLLKAEIDGIIRAVSNNLATSLYRNFGGARGRISAAGPSSDVITLSNPSDVVNFEVGMRLVQSTADGTSGALGSGDSVVTKVDRVAGTVTIVDDTNFVANNYLFQHGDFGQSISGLASWYPTAAPAATLFFGVDRTVDSRLTGVRVDGSSLTITEAIEYADTLVVREGGRPSHFFCNPVDWNRLRISLGTAVVFDKAYASDDFSISFSTINMMGQKGKIQIVSDPDCPAGLAYLLQLNVNGYHSLGEPVRILDQDNNRMLRSGDADSLQIRIGGYGQFGSEAPCYNASIILPA